MIVKLVGLLVGVLLCPCMSYFRLNMHRCVFMRHCNDKSNNGVQNNYHDTKNNTIAATKFAPYNEMVLKNGKLKWKFLEKEKRNNTKNVFW